MEHILGMLDAVGLTTDDLIAHRATTNPQSAGVTLADYVSDVRRSLTKNTDGSYATHFGHLINGVSRQCSCTCARCLDDWVRQATCTCHCKECAKALSFGAMGNTVIAPRAFTQREIEPLVHIVERMATKRAMVENAIRAKRGLSPKPTHGQGAREMCVTALRHLFCKMVQDELIPSNPAENISKGRRSTSKRRAISDRELEELLEVVATGGDDPLLDLAISWAEFELGARRGGLLRMNVGHLDTTGQLISLWEKGNLFRQQPCSLDLINFLSRLAINRGGPRVSRDAPTMTQMRRSSIFATQQLRTLTGSRTDDSTRCTGACNLPSPGRTLFRTRATSFATRLAPSLSGLRASRRRRRCWVTPAAPLPMPTPRPSYRRWRASSPTSPANFILS